MTRCRRRQHAVRKPKVMLMPDPMAGLPPRLLRTPDAARFLGISNRTLEKHRTYGTGPVYRKMGGRVVYGSVSNRNGGARRARASGPGSIPSW
jgi:hypothetical protein